MAEQPRNPAPQTVSIEGVLHEVFERIETRGQAGIPTGFLDLDEALNGLQPGEMIVIGSRPAIGKSAFTSNVVEHIAIDRRLPVAVFTTEMARDQYAQRMICSRAGIDSHKLRRGLLNSDEYTKLATVVGEAAASPIVMASVPDIRLDDLVAMVRAAKTDRDIRAAVIDYVQMIDAPGENRAEQLALISRKLKSLAMECQLALVCLSALNRSPQSGRPRLEDLRGSGTLEDEADVVLLLHREDFYRMHEPDFQPDNIAEVIIAKQRNGPIGTVRLAFLPKSMKFVNLAVQNDSFG